MLAIDNMREVVNSLLEKSKNNRLKWQADSASAWQDAFHGLLLHEDKKTQAVESTAYVVAFPRSKVQFVYISNGQELEVIQFRFLSIDESLLGSWTVGRNSSDWQTAKELFQVVSSQVAPEWKMLLDDIQLATENVGTSTDLTPDANGADFYRWAKGDWRLTEYRGDRVQGEQELTIDERGNLNATGTQPHCVYVLKNVDFRPKEKKVSFSRVEPTGKGTGRVIQKEILEIGEEETRMHGYAQHDGHRLTYEEKQINVADLKAILPNAPYYIGPAREEDYDNALLYFLSHGISGKRRLIKFIGDKRIFDRLSEIYKKELLRENGRLDPMALAAYGVPLFISNLNEDVVRSVIQNIRRSKEFRENHEKAGVR